MSIPQSFSKGMCPLGISVTEIDFLGCVVVITLCGLPETTAVGFLNTVLATSSTSFNSNTNE